MTMPLFQVLLRGENFPGVILGEKGAIGFYTTRFVDAASAAGAEEAALDILRADEALAVAEEFRTEDATVFVEEILAVSGDTPRASAKGFSFFPMEDGREPEAGG
jgi:hypothetical protein